MSLTKEKVALDNKGYKGINSRKKILRIMMSIVLVMFFFNALAYAKTAVTYVQADAQDGIYMTGREIELKVHFNNKVIVSGSPYLELIVGSKIKSAEYVSGSGTKELVFKYKVEAGDRESVLDYNGRAALKGIIKEEETGEPLALSLPQYKSDTGYVGSIAKDRRLQIRGDGANIKSLNNEVAENVVSNNARPAVIVEGVKAGDAIRYKTDVLQLKDWTEVAERTSNMSLTGTIDLLEGNNLVKAEVKDRLGNIREITRNYLLDTTPPNFGATFNSPYFAKEGGIYTANDITEVMLEITAGTDSGSGVLRSEYRIGDEGIWSEYYTNKTFNVLEGEEEVIYVKITDAAGNVWEENIIIGKNKIKDISVGYSHSLILTENGDVYSFGTNQYGQLGLGGTNSSTMPVKIESISNVKQVSAGQYHNMVVLDNGDLYVWGANTTNQLGLGDATNRMEPVKLDALSNVDSVSAGYYHSLVLTESGEVYSFGDNDYGELGLGALEVGINKLVPTKIISLSDVKKVSAGNKFSLVLLESGDVYSFGYNRFGQLGHGDITDRPEPVKIAGLSDVAQVATGSGHSMVLLESGDVYSFGYNHYGESGLGATTLANIPTRIENISNATQISAGHGHSLILLDNGDMYSFGGNNRGELGHGDTANRNIPVKIESLSDIKKISAGGNYSLALASNGDMYSFGSRINNNIIKNISALSNVSGMSAGRESSLILLDNGDVYAFGFNNHGQLGLGDTTSRNIPVRIESLADAAQVSAGSHSLVLTEDGDVYAFGFNNHGQLGLGDTENRSVPTKIEELSGIKAVSAGGFHSLALNNSGEVYAFGYNNTGELGLGDNTDRDMPVKIPGISNIVQISAGYVHSLVLTEDGDVYAFGSGLYGEIAKGSNRYVPTKIEGLPNIKLISAGEHYSLVLSEGGDIYAFGRNNLGQLGLGYLSGSFGLYTPMRIKPLSNVRAVSAGINHSLVLTESGDVYAFGYNYYGQLGMPGNAEKLVPLKIPMLSNMKMISAGGTYSLAVSSSGDIYSFGYNYSGQLGYPDYDTIPSKVNPVFR